MEGKILEALSLIALNFERRAEAPHLAVTLDSQDRRGLKRVVAAMAKDPAAYPSIGELARLARMSVSRFLLAFRYLWRNSKIAVDCLVNFSCCPTEVP